MFGIKYIRLSFLGQIIFALLINLGFILTVTAHGATETIYLVLDLGAGDESQASAINDVGNISGTWGAETWGVGETMNSFIFSGGRIIDLDIDEPLQAGLPWGSWPFELNDVNNFGKVVGSSYPEGCDGCTPIAVAWEAVGDEWVPTTLGDATYAAAINDAGLIAGGNWSDYYHCGSHHRAWRMVDGTPIMLPNLAPGAPTHAYDMNELGHVVGVAGTSEMACLLHGISVGDQTAVVWDAAGAITDLGTLDADTSSAHGINNLGEIVGVLTTGSWDSAWDRPFLYLPTPAYGLPAGMTALDVLDGSSGWALSINDFGQVVGHYQSGGSTRAFLWQNGEAVDLNDRLAPGEDWTIHTANDINQAGVIVGTGSPNGGVSRAIALVPFPGNPPLADARINILKWLTSTGNDSNKP